MKKILLLSAILISSTQAEQPVPDLWWDTIERNDDSPFSGGNSDAEDDDVRAFVKLEHHEEWQTYEDDFVKFRYPKHPLLKLEVKEGEGGIKVEGGVATSVDNSFSRAYVLKAGKATYQVFLLNPTDWLDDGV